MNTGTTDLRAELVAALAMPQSIKSLAASFGVPRHIMYGRIGSCVSAGLVVRVGYGCYAAAAKWTAPTGGASALQRPQLVRDAILAFLTQERQAKEVANHIGRPVPNATGNLAAMIRLGLVVRTAYGRYHRSDLVPRDSLPAKITRPFPMREAVLACLDRPRHYMAVADLVGQSHNGTNTTLHRLAASGSVAFLGKGVFAPSTGVAMADRKPPQTLRHAMLAFLAEPRDLRELAEHLDRSSRATQSHLSVLCHRGLVTRVGHARYQRSDRMPGMGVAARFMHPAPVQNAARACLDRPLHYSVVAALIKVSHEAARSLLRGLVTAGHAVPLGKGVFAPAASAHCRDRDGQRAVCAVRADAGSGSNPEVPCAV